MLWYLVLKNTWYVIFEKYGMGLRFPHTQKYFFIVWHLPNSRRGIVTTDVELKLIQQKIIFLHHQSQPRMIIFCCISFNISVRLTQELLEGWDSECLVTLWVLGPLLKFCVVFACYFYFGVFFFSLQVGHETDVSFFQNYILGYIPFLWKLSNLWASYFLIRSCSKMARII